jgi:putative N6-adenine-specific DNA methylase
MRPESPTQFPVVLSCPAGAERIAASEAAELGVRGAPVLEAGRVRFRRVSLRDVARLAYWHRTSERVWVVVAHFRARHRSELDAGARAMELGRFVAAGAAVHLRVDTHRSRLHHTGAVAEWFAAATGVAAASAAAASDLATVALRLSRDMCEVWVDARGPAKGKRGWREHVSDAPLSEPAAAAVLRAAGWKPGDALFDPCCGSGTLVLEAARVSLGEPVLAGAEPRCFAWELMPGGTVASAKHRVHSHPAPSESRAAAMARPFRGSDVSEAAVRAAKHNAELALCADVTSFEVVDARSVSFGDAPSWIITNPPWGQRLDGADLVAFRRELGVRFRQLDPSWKIAVVEPHRTHAEQLLGTCTEVLRIRCGGTPASVFVRGVPGSGQPALVPLVTSEDGDVSEED